MFPWQKDKLPDAAGDDPVSSWKCFAEGLAEPPKNPKQLVYARQDQRRRPTGRRLRNQHRAMEPFVTETNVNVSGTVLLS
jgi:hypothetical protein